MEKCNVCQQPIEEGFLVEYDEHYCEEGCLHQVYTKEEYKEMFEEGYAYWTIFETEDEEEELNESNL